MNLLIFIKINILVTFITFISFSQTTQQVIFSHPLQLEKNPTISQQFRSQSSVFPETLNILAVMVEFQKDNISTTTGDGSFDLSISSKRKIDAPPHNKAYFQNHLKFVENYFRKVSDGKLIVKGVVLDSVYRLPHQMKYYSPSKKSQSNLELGKLMEDTWKLVDTTTLPPILYEDYKAFIIFHAGAGRDIDLASQYGYDPTPYDIPSIYLSLNSLRKMYNDASYQGVPVRNGLCFIDNSMIIPETESRDEIPFPLGINGLLVASIGSHLGLPDLFDTKTGKTGIGRFGLMDGQSIFSWNGVFPPEPSAWEKYFLGWINPITISCGDSIYSLPAVSLNNNADTIYKVLINPKEYFLIENRNRDANRDSAKVTMVYNGETITKCWQRDTTNFNYHDQDSLYGVIIDVDEFDWSLPGYVDSRTKELHDGGILIWHIDENIIDANLSTNTVNANPNRRGVNLMEADGSQDIGQSYGQFTVGSGTEDGWPLDFWFRGNNAPLRKQLNALTPTSHPSSMSNDRANSHIYIGERFKGDTVSLSYRGPRMVLRIKVGDEYVKPLTGFPIYLHNLNITSSPQIIDNRIFVSSGDSIFAFQLNGLSATSDISGLFSNVGGKSTIASGTPNYLFGSSDSTVYCWKVKDVDGDGVYDSITSYQENIRKKITSELIIMKNGVCLGDEVGNLHFVKPIESYDTTFATLGTSPINSIAINQIESFPANKLVAVSNNECYLSSDNSFKLQQSVGKWEVSCIESPGVELTKSPFNFKRFLILCDVQGTKLFLHDIISSNTLSIMNSSSLKLSRVALADINGDGSLDIIVGSGKFLYAFNRTDASVDYFPVILSDDISGNPIVVTKDGIALIGISTKDGLFHLINKNGKEDEGFPLAIGGSGVGCPVIETIHTVGDVKTILVVATSNGIISGWELAEGNYKLDWATFRQNTSHTALGYESTVTLRSSEFFPQSLAYNWPNPVGAEHDFKTHIRYYVRSDANITIKIIDLAGDLVTELKGSGIGGLDNEIVWDVSNVQSGVYFAHIHAQGASESGSAVIKIAVVK